MSRKERVIILAAGELRDSAAAAKLVAPGDVIICADGGLRHARKLGLLPRAVIGDLDSLSRTVIWELVEAGVKIMRYPREKDRTDLDLAMEYAFSLNPSSVVILGAVGRRTDHFLGNILLLSRYRHPRVPVRIVNGGEEIFLARDGETLREKKGTLVSFIPLAPCVRGVTLEGFLYPLAGEDLALGESRGISNVFAGGPAKVRFREGMLLAVISRGA